MQSFMCKVKTTTLPVLKVVVKVTWVSRYETPRTALGQQQRGGLSAASYVVFPERGLLLPLHEEYQQKPQTHIPQGQAGNPEESSGWEQRPRCVRRSPRTRRGRAPRLRPGTARPPTFSRRVGEDKFRVKIHSFKKPLC